MTDWTGDRCPVCGKPWPVESIRRDCIVKHGEVGA